MIDWKPVFDTVRTIKGSGLKQVEVDALNAAIELATNPPKTAAEPAWVRYGRTKIGEREIVGPNHNSWIAKGWARLGAAWFNDDETPWCGFFVADCMNAAGLPYPGKGMFARAAEWRTYGVSLGKAVVGAIGVKARVGGGHVFFIVGESVDGRYYKALGGNQSNAVSIVDILKTDVDAIRWPAGVAIPSGALPKLAGTAKAGSEA